MDIQCNLPTSFDCYHSTSIGQFNCSKGRTWYSFPKSIRYKDMLTYLNEAWYPISFIRYVNISVIVSLNLFIIKCLCYVDAFISEHLNVTMRFKGYQKLTLMIYWWILTQRTCPVPKSFLFHHLLIIHVIFF